MKTKTAMQELKEKLQVVVDELNDALPNTDQYGYRGAMENVIKDINAQMLAKESQQIVDAYADGFSFGEGMPDEHVKFMSNSYFTQKYEMKTEFESSRAAEIGERLVKIVEEYASQPMSAEQYTLDNGMGTATVMSAEQYSSGAIHSIGEFPAPAMSAEQVEYKVGDKVEIIASIYGHEFELGDIVSIFEFDEDSIGCINEKGKKWWVERSEIKPAPTVKADGWVEQAKNSFELIVKWCEDSGLKQCDIGNKKHMAIYHSLHAAKDALNNFPVCTIPSPRQENKVSKSIE